MTDKSGKLPQGQQDASDVIALARSVGLAGFQSPAAGNPEAQQERTAEVDDPSGDNVIALARSVGLAGFQTPRRADNDNRTGGNAA